MKNSRSIRALLEQSEDQLFQQIIDEQEGVLGLAESGRPGPSPTEAEQARWNRELSKLSADRPSTSHRRGMLRRVVAVSILAALILMLAATAFQQDISNFFITMQEKFTEFRGGESPAQIVAGWSDVYLPDSLPEGFMMSDAYANGQIRLIEYANSEGDRITFYQNSARSSVRVDTEDASAPRPCLLGDLTAYLTQKEELTTLYWIADGRFLSIEFNTDSISEEEIIAMAESIQIK